MKYIWISIYIYRSQRELPTYLLLSAHCAQLAEYPALPTSIYIYMHIFEIDGYGRVNFNELLNFYVNLLNCFSGWTEFSWDFKWQLLQSSANMYKFINIYVCTYALTCCWYTHTRVCGASVSHFSYWTRSYTWQHICSSCNKIEHSYVCVFMNIYSFHICISIYIYTYVAIFHADISKCKPYFN